MIDIAYQVERLLSFSLEKEIISKRNSNYIRNALMSLLRVSEPYGGSINESFNEYETAVGAGIMDEILNYCAEVGLSGDTATERDLMDAKIMGLIMDRPSGIYGEFMRRKDISHRAATDWFYKLNKNVNYIQVERINKNLSWRTETEYGELEITINLSKPEKDPKEIAAAREAVKSDYPKCMLCAENEGYEGRLDHPARQNLRLIPFDLCGENWYFQYSPYVYYNEHCIVLNEEHTPMLVNKRTFERLFEFIDQMPHYFIGSNAGLPIVGGSILSHDHYQGGRHVFPMERAKPYGYYCREGYEDVSVALVKWAMPVIRLSGADKEKIIMLAAEILNIWQHYSDKEAGISAYTGNTPHNAITPIARRNSEGNYELDIVLRNNRTSDEYPMGIFHPHKELHHIKKENIGLIEVMGLAVLPGRLDTEMRMIADILTGKPGSCFNAGGDYKNKADLDKHKDWIVSLLQKYGANNSEERTAEILKREMGDVFLQVLKDAGVYKDNAEGKKQLHNFMLSCKMVLIE